ncbi:MAG: lipopolysaccharide biosynthesis protein [Candidatus Nitrosopumilus sp. bin_68KS]
MKQINNLANIGLADIIGSGVSAVFWFYLAILISPDNFGELHYFISIVGIIAYLSLIGAQNTITVYVAKKIPIQSTFNFISLIIGGVGFVTLYLVFERIDMGFLVIGYIIYNSAVGEILGKREYKNYFKYVLIQKLLTPIMGLSLFYLFDVEGIIYGLAFSYIAFSVIIVKSFKETKIDFTLLKSRKGFIINNYLNSLSGTLNGQVDKMMIMPILGAAVLGNYSLSLQIISAMMIISSIFYKYMLPQQSAGFNIEKTKKLLILSSIILTVIGFFIIPVTLPTIFPKYVEAIDTIKIMSLAIIPLSIGQIFTSKFLAMEKSQYVLFALIISLSVLIPTMIIFGIIFGILGVASSFVFSISIQASYFYLVDRKLNEGKGN